MQPVQELHRLAEVVDQEIDAVIACLTDEYNAAAAQAQRGIEQWKEANGNAVVPDTSDIITCNSGQEITQTVDRPGAGCQILSPR